MNAKVANAAELGMLIRTQRRVQGLRQDDLAEMIGTSHVFLRKLEQGEVSQIQRMFAVLAELGFVVGIEAPRSIQSGPL